jgi:hypothetical protein
MKRGGEVHTVAVGDGKRWHNVHDGKVLSRHRTKAVAAAVGRSIAKRLRVEHSIHRTDGAITEKNSYGNDPVPPKDKS